MHSSSANISKTASIYESVSVWHLTQVRENATVEVQENIGRGAYISPRVRVGLKYRFRNFAMVNEPAELGVGVFVGPGAGLTNDHWKRAVNPDGPLATSKDRKPVVVTVSDGASIGAQGVCDAPVSFSRWSIVTVDAVVNDAVPDFASNVKVSARCIGSVDKNGSRLTRVSGSDGLRMCPVNSVDYQETTLGTINELMYFGGRP